MGEPARKADGEPEFVIEYADEDDPEAREAVVQFLVRLLTMEPQE